MSRRWLSCSCLTLGLDLIIWIELLILYFTHR